MKQLQHSPSEELLPSLLSSSPPLLPCSILFSPLLSLHPQSHTALQHQQREAEGKGGSETPRPSLLYSCVYLLLPPLHHDVRCLRLAETVACLRQEPHSLLLSLSSSFHLCSHLTLDFLSAPALSAPPLPWPQHSPSTAGGEAEDTPATHRCAEQEESRSPATSPQPLPPLPRSGGSGGGRTRAKRAPPVTGAELCGAEVLLPSLPFHPPPAKVLTSPLPPPLRSPRPGGSEGWAMRVRAVSSSPVVLE